MKMKTIELTQFEIEFIRHQAFREIECLKDQIEKEIVEENNVKWKVENAISSSRIIFDLENLLSKLERVRDENNTTD